MKRLLLSLLATLAMASICLAAIDWSKFGYKPKDGFVPNKETAVAIALAV